MKGGSGRRGIDTNILCWSFCTLRIRRTGFKESLVTTLSRSLLYFPSWFKHVILQGRQEAKLATP